MQACVLDKSPNEPAWPGIELFLCLFTISIIIIFNLLWLLSAQRWDLTYLVSFGVTPSQAFTDVWPYRQVTLIFGMTIAVTPPRDSVVVYPIVHVPRMLHMEMFL